ncbi:MAG: hypothetical protein GKS00_22105 [Alphaproteobacteria bacterium]|nr:hypothetical protein [Alphaproteobacteria bacterium]
MKLTIVDGRRQEALPGLSGECPVCEATTIAKCGEKNIWHWAHKGKRQCDHWWENETEWHRNWKNHFPVEWQEVVRWANDGEKHIADVKTDQDWVIEFQHSYIRPDERRSRAAIYENMVWVVDGLRRKNDLKQFMEALRGGIQIIQKPLLVKVHPLDCRLVEEWCTSPVPVFFDFGDEIQLHGLWLLVPMGLDHTAYFTLVGKENFIGWHCKGIFNPQPFFDQIKLYEQKRVQSEKARYVPHRMPYRIPQRSRRRF